MKRFCEENGKIIIIQGERALKQAIARTLINPKGSSLCNRDFGSNLHRFLDKPYSDVAPLISNEVMASLKGIPEFQCKEVEVFAEKLGEGKVGVLITGNFLGEQINVKITL